MAAISSKFRVWITSDELKPKSLLVEPTMKIKELKQQIKEEIKVVDRPFSLYKGDLKLIAKLSIRHYNIGTNDLLEIQYNSEVASKKRFIVQQSGPKKPLKKSRSDDIVVKKKKQLRHYSSAGEIGASISRPIKHKRLSLSKPVHAANNAKTESLDNTASQQEGIQIYIDEQNGNQSMKHHPMPHATCAADKVIPFCEDNPKEQNEQVEHKVGEIDSKQETVQPSVPARQLLIKTHNMDLSEAKSLPPFNVSELKQQVVNNRPRTAPNRLQILTERLFSTLQARSTTTDDLTALDDEILCDKQANEALQITSECSTAEILSIMDALKPLIGDMVSVTHDPDRLSIGLFKEGLMPYTKHRDIVTTSGLTIINKATQLFDLVRCALKVSPKPVQILEAFCRAINEDPVLRTFIPKIEHNIGGISLMKPKTSVKRIASTPPTRCQQCLLSETDLPTMIHRTVDDAKRDWYFLGILLQVDSAELENISQKQDQYKESLGNCYTRMITKWVTQGSLKTRLKPTWQTFTQHLIQHSELVDLGVQLRKEFCKDCCSF